MENRNHVIYPGRNNYYCYRSSSKQRDLRVVKGFPFSRELTGFSLSLSLPLRLSRDYFRIVFGAFLNEVNGNRSRRDSFSRGKVSFPKVGKDVRQTSGRGNSRILPRNRAVSRRVPLSLLVLSADEPREFNRRTSLQEKKTIFPVHLQRCTRSCLQWFPPTRRVSPVEGNGLVSDHVV